MIPPSFQKRLAMEMLRESEVSSAVDLSNVRLEDKGSPGAKLLEKPLSHHVWGSLGTK
jgi:hypothetical protein